MKTQVRVLLAEWSDLTETLLFLFRVHLGIKIHKHLHVSFCFFIVLKKYTWYKTEMILTNITRHMSTLTNILQGICAYYITKKLFKKKKKKSLPTLPAKSQTETLNTARFLCRPYFCFGFSL